MSKGPVSALTQAVLCATALALTSCGGGGGGGTGSTPTPSSPPPPPPPPANVAPSATVTVDDAAPQEGQYFTLDASATTDANTDPLTFSWVQTAGPSIEIPDASLVVLADLRVPELTDTETATFELTVSDGMDSSVVSVDVAFTNIHQMPRFAVEPPLAASLTLNGSVEAIFSDSWYQQRTYIGSAAEVDGGIQIHEISLSALGELVASIASPVPVEFSQPASFKGARFPPTTPGDRKFLVFQEDGNSLRAFTRDAGAGLFEEYFSIDIERPCAVQERSDINGVLVGQRRSGWRFVAYPVRPTAIFPHAAVNWALGSTQSFCAIATAKYPMEGVAFTDDRYRFLYDVMAFDVDTQTMYSYEQDVIYDENDLIGLATAEYQFRDAVPLDMNTSESLTFVRSAPISTNAGDQLGMVMTFTDGVHDGTHRLVIVGWNEDRQLVQATYSWPKGVPVDVMQVDMDNDGRPEIVVFTESSPDAIVFATQSFGGSNFLPLSGPSFFEVGLGATQVVQSGYGTVSRTHLFVTDANDSEIRAYGPIH